MLEGDEVAGGWFFWGGGPVEELVGGCLECTLVGGCRSFGSELRLLELRDDEGEDRGVHFGGVGQRGGGHLRRGGASAMLISQQASGAHEQRA